MGNLSSIRYETMKSIVDTLNEKLDVWEAPRFERGEYPDLDAAGNEADDALARADQARDEYEDLPDGYEKDRAKAEWQAAEVAFNVAKDKEDQEYEKAKADSDKES
jgi:hypothetical protein